MFLLCSYLSSGEIMRLTYHDENRQGTPAALTGDVLGLRCISQQAQKATLMDKITRNNLKEFCERHEITELPEDKQFERFASYCALRRHYNGETFDTDAIHTGGGNDTGLDGVAILLNGSIITDAEEIDEHAEISEQFDITFVFVQADRGESFEGSKISYFWFRHQGFLRNRK